MTSRAQPQTQKDATDTWDQLVSHEKEKRREEEELGQIWPSKPEEEGSPVRLQAR